MHKLGDEYLLLKELGVGGFAKVYKAKNLKYNYVRAIRVIDKYVESEEDDIYKKFLRECGILLRLGNGCHPNIVRVYQPRHVAGRAFVEMDWVDGIDLRKLIARHGGSVPIDEILRMVQEIGSALAYCHHDIYKVCYDRESDNLKDADDGSALITPADEQRLIEKYRVIHNDIHTGNIMQRGDGAYILLDFGLAVDGNSDVVHSSRRQQGAIEFLSAQRLDGEDPAPQDDIYGFGCVVYAMLTGNPPFPVKRENGSKEIPVSEWARICAAHKELTPPPIERQDAPQWLKEMVMRCLAKQPADRYADGYELYNEIKRHAKDLATELKTMELTAKQLRQEKQLLADNLKSVQADRDREIANCNSLESTLNEKNSECKALSDEVERLKKANEKNKGKGSDRWRYAIYFAAGALIMALVWFFVPRKGGASSQLKERIEQLSAQTAAKQATIDSLQAEIGKLGQSKGSSDADYVVLAQDKAGFERRLADLQKKNQQQEKNIKDLNSQIATLKKSSSNTQQQENKIKQLNHRIAILEAEKEKWNKEKGVLLKKIAELSSR